MGRVPRHSSQILSSVPTRSLANLYPQLKYASVPAQPKTDSPNYTAYTIPIMQFPDGKYIMESHAIATRLENDHPTPSLHLDSPLLPKVEDLLSKVTGPLHGVWKPLVPSNLLNPPSKEYFERTREARLGMSLEQLAKESGGEEAWLAAVPGLKELGALIKGNGGPFVMGEIRKFCFLPAAELD